MPTPASVADPPAAETRPLTPARWLWLAVAGYVVLFSFFSIMRHLSSRLGDPDFSIFGQAFYTTLKFGTPFVNTFEGHSTFGNHSAFVFYLLLPFYAIRPGIPTLAVLQSLALGLAAWPLFLIACERLGGKGALAVAGLYLLYHPLHGVNYDQFNPNSFAVAPLMFALHFFLRRRFGPFWIAALVALICKEDVSLVVAFWGLFTCGLAFFEWRAEGPAARWTRLAAHGVLMVIVGVAWLLLMLYVVIPHFRGGVEYAYFAERYRHLGRNLPEVLVTILLRPWRVAAFVLEKERTLYFLEVFLPLGFIPFGAPALLWMTIPTFAVNLLSLFGMHTTGDRYTAYLIPFIFGAAIQALAAMTPARRTTALRWLFGLTVVCTLFLNNTPLRIGFRVPAITAHQRQILALVKRVPPDASVSTQVDIFQHVCERVEAYAGYHPGTDYIIVDATSKWYREQARWDEVLRGVLASGAYAKIYDEDGVRVFERARR